MGLFKSFSEKEIKKAQPICKKVLDLESEMSALSDQDLVNKTNEFKNRYKNGESLDSLLVEAFATVREASWRVLRLKHYPVQIIGGIILHGGNIAEMKTGEGKTLVSTLPVYLNAITGKGVHVVTVNDYLAKRDSEWMGKVYKFLGLTVGLVGSGMDDDTKRKAYACDVTYCTNTELGFDYLRDNMVCDLQKKMQRGFNFAIVDEIDSILIDEARTPLIISGFSSKSDDGYQKADAFVKTLNGITIVEAEDSNKSKLDAVWEGHEDPYAKYADYDYIAEEKTHVATFTEKGIRKMEEYFDNSELDSASYSEMNYYANVALKANTLYKKDVDYVVRNGEIVIVDLGTGRLMPGRRFSKGIHQGIEAKEGVDIKAETVTMASVTYQNFFRKYDKLSGMTGTAMTEKEEFDQIYGLQIVEVPTNRPIQRIDSPDHVFATKAAKMKFVINTIKECYERKQPILVGTASVEKSEELHKLLVKAKIPHKVLNAKFHEKESEIIAQAGRLGSVTVATNMAGRGTDIILGGNAEHMALTYFKNEKWDPNLIAEMTEYSETDNEDIKNARFAFREKVAEIQKELDPEAEKVKELGGLFVLGTERHESRRIDNQLRGRAGRQGDVGQSVFYLSLEDDLMRLFGADRVSMIMQNNLPEDKPIDVRILSNAIQRAQQNIESMHFAQRKSTLDYDMVNAIVRESVYSQRDDILAASDFTTIYENMINKYFDLLVVDNNGGNHLDPDTYALLKSKERTFFSMIKLPDYTESELSKVSIKDIKSVFTNMLLVSLKKALEFISEKTSSEQTITIQRYNLLKNIDIRWQEMIEAMDDIKNSAYLQALGKSDPVKAYKSEIYNAFIDMQIGIYEGIIKNFLILEMSNK